VKPRIKSGRNQLMKSFKSLHHHSNSKLILGKEMALVNISMPMKKVLSSLTKLVKSTNAIQVNLATDIQFKRIGLSRAINTM
jgi:hypothetical protein